MSWPPNPNKRIDTPTPSQGQPHGQSQGQEWRLLEKALMASIEEQRRTRRWGVFFKLLTFCYVLFVVLTFARGCERTEVSTPLSSTPHLAVVDVHGVISSNSDANAEDINEALTKAFEDTNAKAVVLDINSPGGSPVQSDEVWQKMRDLRTQYPDKKLYAVIGDIGASGAYYIASAADEIWVNPSSLVGSIGVIMPNYAVYDALDKLGIKDRTMTAGKYKDILSMSRPLKDEETAHVNSVLASTHQNFIDAVKQGRGNKLVNPEQNELFTGLFWTGKQSLALGLADKTGSVDSLAKSLDLKTVDYTPTDPMKDFLSTLGVSMGRGIGMAMGISADNTPKLQ